MNPVPRVACINDISGFGRCSLTTALPVLSVMGVQACPVPTAVLSKHTGFAQYTFTDLTSSLQRYLDSWRDLDFEWIYSGFLGSVGQIQLVKQFFRFQKARNPACKILLDPVMGDDGRRYTTYSEEYCHELRELVAEADVITPNITEACLLTGMPYRSECLSDSEALALAKSLMMLGCRAAVITGIVQENSIGNLTYELNNVQFSAVHRTECLFSGTGDLFASVLCGALARGEALADGVAEAGRFLSEVAQFTLEMNTPAAEGVLFEPLLGRLAPPKKISRVTPSGSNSAK